MGETSVKFLKNRSESSLRDDPALVKRLEAISNRGRVEAAIHERKLGNSPAE
jgi:hypothetical protein